jgi:hypothetical protein
LEASVEEQTQLRQKMADDVGEQVSQQRQLLNKERLLNDSLARERKQQTEQLEQQERRMNRQADLANEAIARAKKQAASKEQELEAQKLAAEKRAREWEHHRKLLESQAQEGHAKLDIRMRELNNDIKASGMDRDGYLALLINDYDTRIHALTNENEELQSLNFALKLDAEERVGQLEGKIERLQVRRDSLEQPQKGVAQLLSSPAEDRVRDVRLQAVQERCLRAEAEVAALKHELRDALENLRLYKPQENSKSNTGRRQNGVSTRTKGGDDVDSLDHFLGSKSSSSSRAGSARPKNGDDEFDHVY